MQDQIIQPAVRSYGVNNGAMMAREQREQTSNKLIRSETNRSESEKKGLRGSGAEESSK